jgi:GH15 family glucan-1,4-alpha-glucosidase
VPRALTIGNGRMLINFDEHYRIRDLYYPNVGADNHLSARPSRVGIWVDDQFSWLGDADWEIFPAYQDYSLVTRTKATHPHLGIEIQFTDCLDFVRDLLIRKLHVTNTAAVTREIRIYFHYEWDLWGPDVGDTVFYHPPTQSLIAYKGERFFLVNVMAEDSPGLHDWATGVYSAEGAQGSWQDAEDGWLSRNAVSRGEVDCVGMLSLGDVQSGELRIGYHWLAANTSLGAVLDDNRMIRFRTPESYIDRTREYWSFWVRKHRMPKPEISQEIWDLYHRSLLTLRTQVDNSGAIIAGNDPDVARETGDTYSYLFPRVGAIAAVALDRAGYTDLTRHFYSFCRQLPSPDGFLFSKYTPSGAVGSLNHPWLDPDGKETLPVAADNTATLLWALGEHFGLDRDFDYVRSLYDDLVQPALEFLLSHRDSTHGLPLPSFDLWEDTYGLHAYTLAATWAGLRAACTFTAAFGQPDLTCAAQEAATQIRRKFDSLFYDEETGRYVSRLRIYGSREPIPDPTLDASIAGLYLFGMIPAEDERLQRTMAAVRQQLWCHTEVGGLARSENDRFLQVSTDIGNVPGNPWVVTTMWLCRWHIATARTLEDLKPAEELLRWAHHHALSTGMLAEQLHPYTHAPLSVSPYSWSHAEFLLAVQAYMQRHREIA